MATLVVVSTALYTRSGPTAVALFGVVRTAAPALGTPVVTALAGRWSPRLPLAACAAVAAVGSAATALLLAADGPLVTILAAAACTGVALLSMRPLVTALLPTLVTRPAELVASNAATALVDGTSTLLGPLLAAGALATFGAPAALWACAAVLGAAAAFVVTMPHVGRPHDPTAATDHWLRDLAAGLHVLGANRAVHRVTILSAAQTFVRGAVNVLVVVLAITTLGIGDGGVGLLLAAIGVGGLLGFPLAVRSARTDRMARAFAVGLVLWGLPVALVAGVTAPATALVLFAVIGVGNTLVDIASDTLLQRLLRHGELPRALGAFDAVLYAAMAAGAVAAERLLDALGLEVALVVTGLVLPSMAAGAWWGLHRLDRQLRRRDVDVAMLQLHGMFTPLVMATVDHLARSMDHEAFADGEVILRKGDVGDRFLLIEEGAVEILDDGARLAVLGPGDGFGEMALLDDVPRNATAVARSAVRVRSLTRADFLGALASHHRSEAAARELAAERRARPVTPIVEGGAVADPTVVVEPPTTAP